ncbi:MAG: acylphosphatase [Acidimicrobiales bacterium]|jgi:acylphosphatase
MTPDPRRSVADPERLLESGTGGVAEVVRRRRVIVSGDVQNVWFRDTCRSLALERGVAGWVRNRADGTVEAVFEGVPEAVDEMISWCRVGPRSARVAGVEVWDEPLQGEVGFTIR